MNSTINKTFYIYSTELLFLKYYKISKNAVKLGSFLQCSVHKFQGRDGSFWKINSRTLLNHIMKNFQVKHGQCDSIIFPETFFYLKVLRNRPLSCWQQDFFTFDRSWNLATNLSLKSMLCSVYFKSIYQKNKGGVG